MSFFTINFFAFFLLIFAAKPWLINQKQLYKSFLLLVSLVFYSFFGLEFTLLLFSGLVMNYLWINLIESTIEIPAKKRYLSLGIVSNLIFLAVFKYYNFFIDSILGATYNLDIQIPSELIVQIVAPVGISFFIFRAISHLVDSYKQTMHRDFADVAAYLSFFPHIVAGPLARAHDFYADLDNPALSETNWLGIFRLIRGLFKKLVISSYLFTFVQEPFANPQAFSGPELFFAAVLYGVYLYSDFSGYSDMAVGLSNLLGFRTKVNFNQPFRATTPSDFWSRWHISLSDWIRDYLYIPLGGDGRSKEKFRFFYKFRNLIVIMAISGIWHGSGWGFMLWGLGHGLLLVLTDLCNQLVHRLGLVQKKWLRVILTFFSTILTTLSVSILWIPFNISNWSDLENYFAGLFNWKYNDFGFLEPQIYIILALVYLFSFIKIDDEKVAKHFGKIHFTAKFLILIILGYLIVKLSPDLIPPFVYAGF